MQSEGIVFARFQVFVGPFLVYVYDSQILHWHFTERRHQMTVMQQLKKLSLWVAVGAPRSSSRTISCVVLGYYID